VKKHLLCLTVDTDPDGLSGKVTNRQTLSWEGLDRLQNLPEQLARFDKLGRVPITWFVRADGQLESILGSSSYLLEKYGSFWTSVQASGDELGWHPHLYRQRNPSEAAVLISDPKQAREELERLWTGLKVSFHPRAFRNGEGWHAPETYSAVERLGFRCDSTAIPGRNGGLGHPMNWDGAPNQPYFPLADDLCQSGSDRPLLELPMNTWLLQAPHDPAPRVRYMNPAVHSHLFAKALKNWENECTLLPADLLIWVMIFHPDEVLSAQGEDGLYSRSTHVLCTNLVLIAETLQRLGHGFEWATVSSAAERWGKHQQRLIA
jgi:hypothetical protein